MTWPLTVGAPVLEDPLPQARLPALHERTTFRIRTPCAESREPSIPTGPDPFGAAMAMPPRPPAAAPQPPSSGIQQQGHTASGHQRDAVPGPQSTTQRQPRLATADMDMDDLATADEDRTVPRPASRFMTTDSSSHDWNPFCSTDSSPILAAWMLQRLRDWLPRVSDKVRKARFIVQLQAFFKLSFEQFESDDTAFEELPEDPQLTEETAAATAAAATEEQDHRRQLQSQQQQQQGPSGGAAAAAPAAPAAIAAPSSTAAAAAGALARRAAEAAGAVAAALGAGEGKGLVVDIDLAPSAANCLRLLLLSAVHPNSMFRVLWDFLYLPVDLWICLVTPVLVVFVTDLGLLTGSPLGCVEFSIDVLSLLDVSVQLRTAVISQDFTVSTCRPRMARHYLWRRWGLLHLLACLPFLTLINIGPAHDYSTRVLLFRLLRLTKLLRMPTVLQTSNVHTYLASKVFKQKGLVGLLSLLAAVMVTIHHAACYFYFIGVVATHNTMAAPPRPGSLVGDVAKGGIDFRSWVEAEELGSTYKFGRYMVALYWAMYTFLTVGYGDVSIVNTAEKVWAIITAVTGVVMAGWFMGAVGSYMGGTGGAEAKMQQRRQDVFQFLQKRHLRGNLAARVQRYQGGLMWRQLTDKDRQIIDGLPRMLRTEVVLHLYDKVVRKVSFMQTRPPQFVVELLLRLRLRLYEKGDYVVREGEIGREIYFLAAGEVEVRRELPAELQGGHDGYGGDGGSDDPATLLSQRRRRRLSAAGSLLRLSHAMSAASKSITSLALGRASDNLAAGNIGGGKGGEGLGRLSRGLDRVSAAVAAAAVEPVGGAGAEDSRAGSNRTAVGAAGGGGGGGGGGSGAGDVLTRLVTSVPPPPQRRRAAAAAAAASGVWPGFVRLGCIPAGGLFGHVSCLGGEVRRNSMVAASSCEVLALSKEDAQQLAKDWPDIFDDPSMCLEGGRRRSACLSDSLPAFVEHYVPAPGGPLSVPARRGGGAPPAPPLRLRRLSLGRVSEQREVGQAAAGQGQLARASEMRTLSVRVRRSNDGASGGGGGGQGRDRNEDRAPPLGSASGSGEGFVLVPAPGQPDLGNGGAVTEEQGPTASKQQQQQQQADAVVGRRCASRFDGGGGDDGGGGGGGGSEASVMPASSGDGIVGGQEGGRAGAEAANERTRACFATTAAATVAGRADASCCGSGGGGGGSGGRAGEPAAAKVESELRSLERA
ncbi:hypothetical protein PLESTF_001584900 [Pleodorina starrii]|nr:hypothetical protein PLESTF_001584900 [Pleodorina starrii]